MCISECVVSLISGSSNSMLDLFLRRPAREETFITHLPSTLLCHCISQTMQPQMHWDTCIGIFFLLFIYSCLFKLDFLCFFLLLFFFGNPFKCRCARAWRLRLLRERPVYHASMQVNVAGTERKMYQIIHHSNLCKVFSEQKRDLSPEQRTPLHQSLNFWAKLNVST